MISIKDPEEFMAKKEPLICTLDEEKKRRLYELYKELIKSLKRYATLEREIDDEKNPPADFSAALTNLRELERKIALMESELKRILGDKETRSTVRDPSDIGTVGGNGAVVFRPKGGKFNITEGTLTQDAIARLKKCIEAKGKNFKEEFEKKGDAYRDCLNSIQDELMKKGIFIARNSKP